MSKIVCVGCGMMGSHLIQAFLDAGHDVTIVNRTEAKAAPYVEQGARYHDKLSNAIDNSNPDFILFNLDSYENDSKVLAEAGNKVSEKIVVNLSTGTPEGVPVFKKQVEDAGGKFIAGAITCYPKHIGKANSSIVYAGDKASYNNIKDALDALSESSFYLGEDVSAAPNVDLAFLTFHFGFLWGVVQAAVSCKKSGVSLEQFSEMIPPMNSALYEVICPNLEPMIGKGYYPPATDSMISTHQAAIAGMLESYEKMNVDASVLEEINNLMLRSIEAGDGDRNIEALAKIMEKK